MPAFCVSATHQQHINDVSAENTKDEKRRQTGNTKTTQADEGEKTMTKKQKKKDAQAPSHHNVIEAAGAVIFRTNASTGDLEIVLEHRAKYDDWSIPKGKVDPHESLAHTAVREVGEETGLPIRLSAIIGEVSYPLHLDGSEGERNKKHKGGKHHRKTSLVKHVTYWAGVPISQDQQAQREQPFGHPDPRDKETDRLQWLSVDQARERLTYPDDRRIIDNFADFIAAGGDHAATLIYVRHGAAEKRKQWLWEESLRPLTPRGMAESLALTREIACYAPSRLLSSPWRRCVQTLSLYAQESGMAVEALPQMTEEAAAENPPAAVSAQENLLRELTARGLTDRQSASTVVCVHRPVLGVLLPLIAEADESHTAQIPSESPWLSTGNGIAITVTRHEGRLVVLDAHPLEPLVY